MLCSVTEVTLVKRTSHGGEFGDGRAVGQAFSRSLPTATTWVRGRVKSCGLVVDRAALAAGFLQLLRFPLPLTHSTNCSTIIAIYHPGLVQQASKWPQE
jgi:hypothetical protein